MNTYTITHPGEISALMHGAVVTMDYTGEHPVARTDRGRRFTIGVELCEGCDRPASLSCDCYDEPSGGVARFLVDMNGGGND